MASHAATLAAVGAIYSTAAIANLHGAALYGFLALAHLTMAFVLWYPTRSR